MDLFRGWVGAIFFLLATKNKRLTVSFLNYIRNTKRSSLAITQFTFTNLFFALKKIVLQEANK